MLSCILILRQVLVFLAFTSVPVSFLATSKATVFFYILYVAIQYLNIIRINQLIWFA